MSNKKQVANVQTDNRSDKMRKYSALSIVLAVAIVFVACFLFDKIFNKSLTYDFSDAAQNSISQGSIDYINSLPADTQIRIVGLFSRPEKVDGTSYQYIVPLLDDYVKKSDGKITVEYIDPVANPTIINQLDPTNSYDLSQNLYSFVVEYHGKLKVIAPIDCYSYDEEAYWSTGKYYISGNNTEYTFTNAMNSLTGGFSKKVYIVTGLKEDGSEYISKIMDSMSLEVQELKSSESFTVPEDCDLLIINGPSSDISEKMYVAMTEYINRGGKMLVAVDYNSINVNEKFDRLNLLVNQMGINIDPMIVVENDPGMQLNGDPFDSTVKAAEGFSGFANLDLFHSTFARSVRTGDSPDAVGTAVPVLQTSSNATVAGVDEYGNITNNSNYGVYNVAMYSASDVSASEIFVFGTLNFTSDNYISSYGYNDTNMDFLRSCLRELTDSQNFNSLNIATKNVNSYSLDADRVTTSNSTLMLIIFMIIIPFLLVSVAVIIYSKRKNL
ncbi:MAG: GldG family protein [Clostridiales bacterium]|nr:GldG family protein [Clostridiales bacterium]